MTRIVQALSLALLLVTTIAPTRAADIKLWTADIVQDERTPSTLKPLTLVAARNGTFSARVVLESPATIKGLRAAASPLKGPATIDPKNIQLRYGIEWETQRGGFPRGADILLDKPADIPAGDDGKALGSVWLTVNVPADAKPGDYTGEVTVSAASLPPTKIPVKLEVVPWTLPSSDSFRTWMDFIQSPDTLALEYKVPLWSDKHFELIAQSMRILSQSGSRVLYVPLICRTNLGNEESMVRWIPKGDGKYEYDYSILDRYLDVAEKNLGKPKLVIFQVWDICQSMNSLKRGLWGGENDTRKEREELLGKGPRVTTIDPATKKTDMVFLPRYEDPASKALWGPMFGEVKKRMQKRGLAKTMNFGLLPDLWPNKKELTFWNEISGNVPWAIHGHAGGRGDTNPGNKSVDGVAELGYAAYVYNLEFNVNPDKGRHYGWQKPGIMSNYYRGGALNSASLTEIREFPAFNITGGQRGGGRMGGDTWPVVKTKKGARAGFAYNRYPENNWRNLDLHDWFLAPGPDGPVATARLESLKEGIQECEARIFLEDALLDPAKKSKLGDDLATRCQQALDEHHRAMWKTVWTKDEDLKNLGLIGTGRNPAEGLWQALVKNKTLPEMPDEKTKKIGPWDFWASSARKRRSDESKAGEAWFAEAWQSREKKLFQLAAEVAAKLPK